MFRLLLVIAVIAIGFDAIVHQGAYTREIWTGLVGLFNSLMSSIKQ